MVFSRSTALVVCLVAVVLMTNFVSEKESGIAEKIDAALPADISRAYPDILVEPKEERPSCHPVGTEEGSVCPDCH